MSNVETLHVVAHRLELFLHLPQRQPKGGDTAQSCVKGYVGWANRLIFASSYLWVALTALAVVKR